MIFFASTAGLIGLLLLIGTISSAQEINSSLPSATYRAIHSSPTSSAVTVYVNGRVNVRYLSFGRSSRFTPISDGANDFTIAIAGRVLVDVSAVSFAGSTYTEVLIGSGSTGPWSVRAALYSEPFASTSIVTATQSTHGAVRFLHGAVGVGPLEIYLFPLTTSAPVSNSVNHLDVDKEGFSTQDNSGSNYSPLFTTAFGQVAPVSGFDPLSIPSGLYGIIAKQKRSPGPDSSSAMIFQSAINVQPKTSFLLVFLNTMVPKASQPDGPAGPLRGGTGPNLQILVADTLGGTVFLKPVILSSIA